MGDDEKLGRFRGDVLRLTGARDLAELRLGGARIEEMVAALEDDVLAALGPLG